MRCRTRPPGLRPAYLFSSMDRRAAQMYSAGGAGQLPWNASSSGARCTPQESDMPAGIFISYRRDDSRHAAGRLADDLSQAFGAERIFRDIEGIELGATP